MPRNFNLRAKLAFPSGKIQFRDPKFLARLILGILLAANLIAAGILMFPPGGSAEDLERELTNLQSQQTTKRALLEKTRQHVASVELGRSEGDQFLSTYFLPSRTAFEILVSQLLSAAEGSKIKAKEHGYSFVPVEGSDTLRMLDITGTYEGTYADLLHFVHEIDKSQRLLIIESLNVAPQQGSDTLSVAMKLETFVREDGSLPMPEPPGPAKAATEVAKPVAGGSSE